MGTRVSRPCEVVRMVGHVCKGPCMSRWALVPAVGMMLPQQALFRWCLFHSFSQTLIRQNQTHLPFSELRERELTVHSVHSGKGVVWESFMDELKDLLSHLKKTSVGKFSSANVEKEQETTSLWMGCHVPTCRNRPAAHTLSGVLWNKESLYPWIGFELFEKIQRTDYDSYIPVIKIKQYFFASSCCIQ